MVAHTNFYFVIHISIWNGSSLEIAYILLYADFLEDADRIYLIISSQKLNGQNFHRSLINFFFFVSKFM